MSDHTTKSENIRAISKRLWSTPLADGSILFVQMQQLWDMAAGLPRKKVRVSELNAVDEVRWFSEAKSKIADGLVVLHISSCREAVSWVAKYPGREIAEEILRHA